MANGSIPPHNNSMSVNSYACDPLLTTIKKWQLGLFPFAMAYLGLYVVSSVLSLIVFLLFWPNELPTQLESALKPSSIAYTLLLPPLAAGFYHWISYAPGKLIDRLLESDVLKHLYEENLPELKQWISYAQKLFGNPIWPVLSIIVVVAAFVLPEILESQPTRPPGEHAWVSGIIMIPAFGLGWYMVCMIVAREFCVIKSVGRLFKGMPIKLYPWHPDRCGGLGYLSQYALRFSYFIGIAGFGLSLLTFQAIQADTISQDFLLMFALVAYAFLAPYCFFATLGTAHQAMQAVKEKQLAVISGQFNRVYQSSQEALEEENPEILKGLVEKIENIQRLQKITEAFPVWPFDVTSIRRFFAAVVGSLLPLFASLAVELGKIIIG